MKRRDFLTSAAVLSLFAPGAWAAKKSAAGKSSAKAGASKSSAKAEHGKSSGKAGHGKAASEKSSRKSGGKHGREHARQQYVAPPPAGPVVHTADDSVIENPPVGTTATRLPPVRAAEPPSEWRTYEITTTINLRNSSAHSKLWLPLPLNQDTLFQRTLGHAWEGNQNNSSMRRLPDGDLEVFHCEWRDSNDGKLQLKTLVTTADRHFDITKRTVAPEREDILRRNLQASRLIPNEGLAFQLGERIIGRIKDPVAQAKAIYDWVIDNSIYDTTLPACGTGDVRRMLVSGQYVGRSADINGLFVSICRATGIPARCVYGLRVAPSRLFRSLGLSSEDATHSQHVRAEFYVPGYGWIPVDPSDVRRAIALEVLSDRDSKLFSLKKILFGLWEMNWIAFNVGSDILLPGKSATQPFLLLPQLETREAYRDVPSTIASPYTITTRRVEV